MSNAFRIAGLACRAVALLLLAYVILTGWRPILSAMHAYELHIELRRKATPPRLPEWIATSAQAAETSEIRRF